MSDFNAQGPLINDTTLVIAPGTPLRQIGQHLSEAGVLRHPFLWEAMLTIRRENQRLKAGEYRFTAGITPAQVAEQMTQGRVLVHQLTIPEGWIAADVVKLLNAEPALTGPPLSPPAEGSLLPETYQFLRGQTRLDVLRRMQEAQAKLLAKLWEGRAPRLPYRSPRDAVTLASVIEKETGRKDERPHVASVFLNRLAQGIPLQSDPTTIYGLYRETGILWLTLGRADLLHPTPYNTYTLNGLPAGPICNPGRASLEAALQPAVSDDFYFVADGAGGHRFAPSLAEHNRNVATYRAQERERATPLR